MTRVSAALLIALMPGVTRAASAQELTPWTMPSPPPGVAIEHDVTYLAPIRAEKLDLYLPTNRPPGLRSPAVIAIHGGGWNGGDKARPREYITCTTLALAGYVCASIEYAKEGEQRWPQNVKDAKNAVRWLRVNAERLQVDPAHIGVIGGSAGGHLAMMVAYSAGLEELEPEDPYPGVDSRVQACVDMYGPSNLLTRQATDQDGTPNGRLRDATPFSDTRDENPDKWKLASPVYHVSKDSPATLILHGTADTTVDRDQSNELARVLKQHGVEHRLMLIPGAGHTFALKEAAFDLRPDVVAFFDAHLKPAR